MQRKSKKRSLIMQALSCGVPLSPDELKILTARKIEMIISEYENNYLDIDKYRRKRRQIASCDMSNFDENDHSFLVDLQKRARSRGFLMQQFLETKVFTVDDRERSDDERVHARERSRSPERGN